MTSTPTRLSARAYARHRGCDHKAVTQAIETGRRAAGEVGPVSGTRFE